MDKVSIIMSHFYAYPSGGFLEKKEYYTSLLDRQGDNCTLYLAANVLSPFQIEKAAQVQLPTVQHCKVYN